MDSDRAVLNRYKEHFQRIDGELDEILNSRVRLIEDMGSYSLLGDGKRLRPLLFILCCQLCGYQEESVHRLSIVFECIHTSSLLHDDVMDNAEIRRKKPSANHIWGNHAAVLEGDFLYSKSMEIAVSANSLAFLERLTETTTRMTEGQILDLVHTDDWNTTEADYFEIITGKTATLISAACACGAIISGAGKEAEESLAGFGLNAGIAFQLMDDLLDYTSSEDIVGKPVGKDLKEGKITLPLIYTLGRLEFSERERLENMFTQEKALEDDYLGLIELVRVNGAVDRIKKEAKKYSEKAGSHLDGFAESPTKQELLQLNRYLIDRKY